MMATTFSEPPGLSCLSPYCTIDPEEILNDILQESPKSNLLCINCEEGSKVTSRCKDCDELLCDNCVRAHFRVKFTKDHCIISLEGRVLSPSSSSSSSSHCLGGNSPNSFLNLNTNNSNCDSHLSDEVRMYCDNCNEVFCQDCNFFEHKSHYTVHMKEALECARNSSMKLLAEAQVMTQSIKECLDYSQRMEESINSRYQIVSRDIRSMMHRFHLAVEERETELLTKLEILAMSKRKSLQQQSNTFKTLYAGFMQTSKELSDALECGVPMEIIQVKDVVSAELRKLRSIRSSVAPVNDFIQIIPPDSSILLAIGSMGDITGHKQFADSPSSIGEEILRNISPKLNDYYEVRKQEENPNFMAPIMDHMKFHDYSRLPKWTRAPCPPSNEMAALQLTSPKTRSMKPLSVRDYRKAGPPRLVLGEEGSGDGQLCRPWGVCCSPEGNIIVADRSNNRIQIFSPKGKFLSKFGSHGSEPGFFDRPAGVAVDPRGRIVVADKDNHRIQVFTRDGTFIFTFGDKGSKIGQFNYPWDVAVDSEGKIAVCDSRNHRIQLFDNTGTFITKYGFEVTTNMIKHFDSPRGICFGRNGSVIATDFNNHRLVVIEPNFRNARFIGTEGSREKQFLRPQGVAVDPAGNIIVADSRNNRLQVFEPNGTFLCEFGVSGNDPGQLDRPSGVCLSPTGEIVVVDFGNNRVQVF